MPSPFPGMDPYLEDAALWPSFRHQLVAHLYQIILPSLADRYRALICQRRYMPGQAAAAAGEPCEEYIEIRRRDEGQLVTLIDVVNPANKTTDAGRAAYLDTRQQAKEAGANLVELDLVLQGQPTLNYSRDALPDRDYVVTVTRAVQPERHEIYTTTLQKRLPRFRLPVAADDRDTVVDLQAAFARTYDTGGFARRIDYRREPPVPLPDERRPWVAELLQAQRFLKGTADGERSDLPHEHIAVAAYHLWQSEGCPPGRDQEYWQRAVEQLKQGAGHGQKAK